MIICCFICSITWLNIKQCKNNTRITAFGCENGFVNVSTVTSDSSKDQSEKCIQVIFLLPISSDFV